MIILRMVKGFRFEKKCNKWESYYECIEMIGCKLEIMKCCIVFCLCMVCVWIMLWLVWFWKLM